MNAAKDQIERSCPRCGAPVPGERLDDGSTRTILWRCACGWSHLVTESGVVSRGQVRRMLDRLSSPPPPSEPPTKEPEDD